MAYTTLPWSMEQDRQNQIKASSTHVDDNFNTLLSSLNNKMDKDGSVTAIADMPMGGHKITGLATPTASADATTKGYVDNKVTDLDNRSVKLSGDQSIAGVKTFSSSPIIPAPTTDTAASTKKYVDDSINTLSATCVKLSGNQTIGGTKTFSSKISGSITGNCDGNAGSVTNGVYTSGNQTIAGTKTFSSSPIAPTVSSASDNSTKVATTAFVIKVLDTLYPVGSIYVGTQSSCPLSTLIPGSTWTKIEGRYLLASGTLSGTSETYSATKTVDSGLPNITGRVGFTRNVTLPTGAFSAEAVSENPPGGGNQSITPYKIDMDASRSSNVFGKSSAVRAPAYVVNVWRRLG